MTQNIKTNYNQLMQKEINDILLSGKKPTLLLHSCCGPCSSYVLRVLQEYFNITVFYYNPNLYPDKEYTKRLNEQKRLIKIYNKLAKEKNKNANAVYKLLPIKIKTIKFNPQEYYNAIKGQEDCSEGDKRCYLCYKLRIDKTAEIAKKFIFDYFTTTLTVSPYKNAEWVNELGEKAKDMFKNAKFLNNDFKKSEGYKKSIEYSKEYNLYRQNYCGCKFSINKKME
ncbi:MAG: epoxyqueuosine reductase QueH [Clostridia bacterium]|jgi:hypothetical protein|nr:epoxyqueuosine reductase QueH [Clostridia bacterium]MDD4275769.1 epoxyqueuosine reductase QueH [Clostridia bacterium]